MSLCRAAEEIRCIVLRFDNLLVSIMVAALQINSKHHGYNNANAHFFHLFNAGGDCGCHSNWPSGGPEPRRRVPEEAIY